MAQTFGIRSLAAVLLKPNCPKRLRPKKCLQPIAQNGMKLQKCDEKKMQKCKGVFSSGSNGDRKETSSGLLYCGCILPQHKEKSIGNTLNIDEVRLILQYVVGKVHLPTCVPTFMFIRKLLLPLHTKQKIPWLGKTT